MSDVQHDKSAPDKFRRGLIAYARGDSKRALKEFLPLAEAGNLEAQYNVACLLLLSQDVAEAQNWLVRAAEQGHPGAQNTLGQLYRKGDRLPRNDVAAFRWLKLAAEKGHSEARRALGTMYEEGEGVGQDLVQAYMWHHLADEAVPAEWMGTGINFTVFYQCPELAKRMSSSQIREAKALAGKQSAAIRPKVPAGEIRLMCDVCLEGGSLAVQVVSAKQVRKAVERGFAPSSTTRVVESFVLSSLGVDPDSEAGAQILRSSRAKRFAEMDDCIVCNRCRDGIEKYASSTGCFIATAACGWAYAPAVRQLREFRDQKLRACRWGRAMIDSYETLSPAVADVVRRSSILRIVARTLVVRPAAFLAGLIGHGRRAG